MASHEHEEYARALRAAEEAAEWLERLKTASPRDRDAYLDWLRDSSLHVREMLLATAWDAVLNDLDKRRRHAALPRPQSAQSAARTGARKPVDEFVLTWRLALTGITATLLLGVGMLVFAPSGTYETRVGELKTLTLSDGSIAQLNTQSSLRTAFSDRERTLHLSRGQATFEVRKDERRPFVVYVGHRAIRAVGTKFDIRVDGDAVAVTVLEGRVSVSGGAEDEEVSAGESLRVGSTSRPAMRVAIDPGEALAWQQRRLIFHDRSLREIAAEFNRYNRLQFSIDVHLADRTFSGVFAADDPQSFATYLSKEAGMLVERRGDRLDVKRVRDSNPAD